MPRAIDPLFSTQPIQPWMAGPKSSLDCYATNGPDDPDNCLDGGELPLEPQPEPAMSGIPDSSSFAELSLNIHPIPAAETLSEPKMIFWSHEGTTTEYTGKSCTLHELGQFSLDKKTGMRKAVKVSTQLLPFEFSVILFAAGQREYVLQHVDDITFCPFIIITDLDQRNLVHIPSAAMYAQNPSVRERKLFVNVHKLSGRDPNGDLVMDPRTDFEIFPDIIDGAVRLHIMTNVMNGDEPAGHLELSYIRKMSIPLQMSSIDAITKVYEARNGTRENAYIYLKKLREELAQELKQL